jgi:hypothetical protein
MWLVVQFARSWTKSCHVARLGSCRAEQCRHLKPMMWHQMRFNKGSGCSNLPGFLFAERHEHCPGLLQPPCQSARWCKHRPAVCSHSHHLLTRKSMSCDHPGRVQQIDATQDLGMRALVLVQRFGPVIIETRIPLMQCNAYSREPKIMTALIIHRATRRNTGDLMKIVSCELQALRRGCRRNPAWRLRTNYSLVYESFHRGNC